MRNVAIIIFVLFFSSCLTDEQQAELNATLDSTNVQQSGVDTFVVGGNADLDGMETPEGDSLRNANDSAIDNIRQNLLGSNAEREVEMEDNIIRNPDVGPSFPGGSVAMDKYIANNLVYPLVAFQNDITGTVNVRFVVETDGRLSGIVVYRALGYGCDEAAVDLIKSMPKWIPGKKGGVNVRCLVVLPISFGSHDPY